MLRHDNHLADEDRKPTQKTLAFRLWVSPSRDTSSRAECHPHLSRPGDTAVFKEGTSTLQSVKNNSLRKFHSKRNFWREGKPGCKQHHRESFKVLWETNVFLSGDPLPEDANEDKDSS